MGFKGDGGFGGGVKVYNEVRAPGIYSIPNIFLGEQKLNTTRSELQGGSPRRAAIFLGEQNCTTRSELRGIYSMPNIFLGEQNSTTRSELRSGDPRAGWHFPGGAKYYYEVRAMGIHSIPNLLLGEQQRTTRSELCLGIYPTFCWGSKIVHEVRAPSYHPRRHRPRCWLLLRTNG
jgi:hypothetical protein